MAVRVEREHGRHEIAHDRVLLVGLRHQEIEVIGIVLWKRRHRVHGRIAVQSDDRSERIFLQRQRERLAHGVGHGRLLHVGRRAPISGTSYERRSRFTTLVLSATFVISTCTSILKTCRYCAALLRSSASSTSLLTRRLEPAEQLPADAFVVALSGRLVVGIRLPRRREIDDLPTDEVLHAGRHAAVGRGIQSSRSAAPARYSRAATVA